MSSLFWPKEANACCRCSIRQRIGLCSQNKNMKKHGENRREVTVKTYFQFMIFFLTFFKLQIFVEDLWSVIYFSRLVSWDGKFNEDLSCQVLVKISARTENTLDYWVPVVLQIITCLYPVNPSEYVLLVDTFNFHLFAPFWCFKISSLYISWILQNFIFLYHFDVSKFHFFVSLESF